ncbi:MAG: GEVED domain-containing protein [Flavobacteriales bacterium]
MMRRSSLNLVLVGALAFATSADAQVIFNEPFTGGASTAGFTVDQIQGTCTWTYSNPGGRTITGAGFDTNFAIFDSDNCSFGAGYSEAALVSPVFDASVGNFILSFGQQYQPYFNSSPLVQVWDGSQWNVVFTPVPGSNFPATPELISLNITSATGASANSQVRFVYSGDYAYWWALDNIQLEAADCIYPSDVAVSSILTDGVSLSWTDNGADSYAYEIRTSGAGGSGATGLATSGTAASGSTPVAVSGLTPNTQYYATISGICDGTNSPWSVVIPFMTTCVASDIPFFEDFNSSVLPNIPSCFRNEIILGDVWQTTEYTPPGFTPNAAVIYYDYSGNPADGWLHTGGMNLQGGVAYRLSYNYGTGYAFDIANMSVYAESGPMAADTLVQLANHYQSTGAGALFNTVDFTPLTTGVYYFGFRYYCGANEYPSSMNLDNIKVVLVPSCEEVSGLTAAATDFTEGLVSWTASVSNPANGYDLYYSTDPTPPTASTTPSFTGITGTSQLLTSLATGVPIYVWVRSACSGSDQSLWTGSVTFIPGTFQIGTGDATDTNLPIYSCYGYNYSQQIYLASEYNGGSLITNVAFKYTGQGTPLSTWQSWTVYMGSTSQSSFAGANDWVPYGTLTQVWSGDITPIAGEWMNLTLTTPFAWDGVSNIVVAVDENTPSYSCTAEWASFNAGSNRGMLYYSDGTNPDPLSPPMANYGPASTIPQLQLAGITPADCDVLPTPGATIAPVSICPNVPFVVSVQNPSTDGGITRQWEVSADGITWTNAPGNSTFSSYLATQTVDTWYRAQVTCDIAGTTASTPVQVLTNAPTECYCTTIDFQYTVEPICNVLFAGIDHSSPSGIDGAPAYEDFTNTPPANVTSGFDFPISVTGNTNGGFSTPYIYAFFDWDQDGIFETSVNLGNLTGQVCTVPLTNMITVPANALPGISRMRIVKSAYEIPSDPCMVYSYGQAEDYLVNVFLPTPCTGTPAPGATTGPASICPLAQFSVTVENIVLATGLTYQWERSNDGITWTNAPGNSTTPSYSTSITDTTWFRVQADCDAGGSTYSTPLEVTIAPPTECYCAPPIFNYDVDPICSVSFADLDHTSDATINGSPGYEDFSAFTANVKKNNTYTFTVGGHVDTFFGDNIAYVSAFFDWNRDGTFETLLQVGTFIGGSDNCDSVATIEYTVPNYATYGTSRMRIMIHQDNFFSSPCDATNQYNGQAEEYTINVMNDVGVAEIADNLGVAVYPNPASTVLHIATPQGKAMNVKVMDLAGHLVIDQAQVRDLDISGLAAGSYMLVATDKDGTQPVHARFVKQ